MNKKLSIVIPVYNREEIIKKCLDSILSQNREDIEIICVDNCSTDKSLEVLKSYQVNNENIKVLQEEEKGAALARNKGLSVAIGEYLWFVDSDDSIAENSINTLLNYVEKESELDIVLFLANNVNQKNEKSFYGVRLPYQEPFFTKKEMYRLFKITVIPAWSKIYKKSFIDKHNIQFQNLTSRNDHYFNFISLALSNKIGYINEVLYSRYMGAKNAITNNNLDSIYNVILAARQLRKRLQKENLYECCKKTFEKVYFRSIILALRQVDVVYDKKILQEAEDLLEKKRYKRRIKNFYSFKIFKLLRIDDKREFYFCGIKMFAYKKSNKN